MTIKGERKNSLKKMLTPVCIWKVSDVKRLTKLAGEFLSTSAWGNDIIFSKRSLLSWRVKPTAALAE